jgi:hypothetical protein
VVGIMAEMLVETGQAMQRSGLKLMGRRVVKHDPFVTIGARRPIACTGSEVHPLATLTGGAVTVHKQTKVGAGAVLRSEAEVRLSVRACVCACMCAFIHSFIRCLWAFEHQPETCRGRIPFDRRAQCSLRHGCQCNGRLEMCTGFEGIISSSSLLFAFASMPLLATDLCAPMRVPERVWMRASLLTTTIE